MTSRSLLAGATAAAFLSLAGVAPAQTDEAYEFEFSTAKTGRSAGFTAAGILNGQQVIDRFVISLPSGTRIDASAVEQCNDTKAQIQQQEGPENACTDDAEVGAGVATALVGGTSVDIPMRVWNRRNALLISFKVGDAGFFAISPIEGRRIMIPLGQASAIDARVTAFGLRLDRSGTAAKPYIRTPRTCPSSRKLSSSLQAGVFQAGFKTLRATTRCSRTR
jgi:hypothetical protein